MTVEVNLPVESAAEVAHQLYPTYGTQEAYTIQYDAFIREFGGIVQITTSAVNNTPNVFEGSTAIRFPLPFKQILDYQCTALDNNTGSLFEHAHLGQVTNTEMNVYATTNANNKVILVKWYAKGVI